MTQPRPARCDYPTESKVAASDEKKSVVSLQVDCTCCPADLRIERTLETVGARRMAVRRKTLVPSLQTLGAFSPLASR